MPYRTEWIEPEIYFEHNGLTVYHTYRDDEEDQGRQHDIFSFCTHSGPEEFDVRELTEPPTGPKMTDHPPYMGCERAKWFGFANYKEWSVSEHYQMLEKQWAAWHDDGFDKAAKNTITHAIDTGEIKPGCKDCM